MMRPIGSHIQAAIVRAITAIAAAATPDRNKPILVIESLQSRDWASATFVGAVHEFDVRIDGSAEAAAAMLARLVDALPDHEISIVGQIVAEIACTPRATTSIGEDMISIFLTVNALTIND